MHGLGHDPSVTRTQPAAMAEVRRCFECNLSKDRTGFSNSQWKKAPQCRCMACTGVVTAPAKSVSGSSPPPLWQNSSQPRAPRVTSQDQVLPNAAADGDEIRIDWPQPLPIPSNAQEAQAIRALFPDVNFAGSRRSLESDLQRYTPRWDDMSSPQQQQIQMVCDRIHFDLRQAIGLRTTVFRSAQPWKFEGNEHETQLKAEAFEEDVESVLRKHGVVYDTQADQMSAYHAARDAGSTMPPRPTPDFLIHSRLLINNRRVEWIEVKNFYGAGVEQGIKPWIPTLKTQKQIAKYIAAYGPAGAVILKHGYAVQFRARTPTCVQLLDAGVLRKE